MANLALKLRSLFRPGNRQLWMLLGRAALVIAAVLTVTLAVGMLIDIPRTEGGGIDFGALLGSARDSAWAPLLVCVVYVLLNFAGIPQFLLVGGTAVVFGPWAGFAYAWFGTMVSSSVGFWLGYFSGSEILRRFGGGRANAFSERVGKHGILASAVVRVVPAGPAILVNMAAGLSHITYGKFLIGTGLGIAPKVALIALVSGGVLSFAQSGNPLLLVGVGALILGWIALALWMRKRALAWKAKHEAPATAPVGEPASAPASEIVEAPVLPTAAPVAATRATAD